jgi:hypothetical protein
MTQPSIQVTVLPQKRLQLAGVEIAEHQAVHLDHRHESLTAEVNRPLPRRRVGADVADSVFPTPFIKPRLGLLAPASHRPGVENDLLRLFQDFHGVAVGY